MAVTITEYNGYPVKKIKFVVTSIADGSASGATPNRWNSEGVRFVAVPDGGGTQPTDQFDIALNDSDGYDVLAGQGANLGNAAVSTKVASMGAVCNSALTLSASNMGNAKGATFYVYLR